MFLSLSVELGLKRHLSSSRGRFERSEDKTVSPSILLPVGAVRGRQATPQGRAGDDAKCLQLAFEFCYFVLQSVWSSTV
jgi:hypothetical protein